MNQSQMIVHANPPNLSSFLYCIYCVQPLLFAIKLQMIFAIRVNRKGPLCFPNKTRVRFRTFDPPKIPPSWEPPDGIGVILSRIECCWNYFSFQCKRMTELCQMFVTIALVRNGTFYGVIYSWALLGCSDWLWSLNSDVVCHYAMMQRWFCSTIVDFDFVLLLSRKSASGTQQSWADKFE